MTTPERDLALPYIGLVEDTDHDFRAYQRGFAKRAELRRWERGEAFIEAVLKEHGLLASLSLLIVDLNLPGIDGVHLVHTIRKAPGGDVLPIVMLTGSSAEPDIMRALEAQVTEYEIKPRNAAELRTMVDRTMGLLAAGT